MESPFKTPSKFSPFQMLPSSGSSSPFTPKRSRIKRKNNEENSVSRVLMFDDPKSRSPFNSHLEFLPLSQQVSLSIKNELTVSEEKTPVKTQQPNVKENTILLSPSIKNHPNRFNIIKQEKNTIKQSPRKKSGSNNSTPSKKMKPNVMENSKPITHYFKPTQKRPDSINDVQSVKHESNAENMNFTLKSVKSVLSKDYVEENSKTNEIKSPNKKSFESPPSNKNIKPFNSFGLITPSKNGTIPNSVSSSPRINDYLENKIIISGGDTYSRFVKFIVFKPEPICFGKGNFVTKIENSSDDELKIFGRLISRKHGWIRFDGSDGLQKYKESNICDNFEAILMALATNQIINTNVTSCGIDDLLNILKAPELKELQKTFKINPSSNKSKTKPEMIKSFITFVKNQKTFAGNSVINNLKKRINEKLGYCLKISDESRENMLSCLILESYPYFKGEEKERFHDCFSKFSLVEKKQLKFPKFEVKPVSVNFTSKNSFEMYKAALNLRGDVQFYLEHKDNQNAINTLNNMFEKLKSAISNKYSIDSFTNVPTYMRKYSAVSVYAHTLFKNISIIKKSDTDKDLAKKVLEYLLKHNEFLISKKADLHIELSKVYESQYKQLDLAAELILNGLKDNSMSELDRQILSKRAMIYVNRKVRKLDSSIKKELMDATVNAEFELPNITINGKLISTGQNGPSGRKQVYSKRTENGSLIYMSVEELAISHYKDLGFLNGIHDEGQLIKSMFLLCFWDIIYDSYPPHILFIRQFQDCPLDWRTRHFYTIREKKN